MSWDHRHTSAIELHFLAPTYPSRRPEPYVQSITDPGCASLLLLLRTLTTFILPTVLFILPTSTFIVAKKRSRGFSTHSELSNTGPVHSVTTSRQPGTEWTTNCSLTRRSCVDSIYFDETVFRAHLFWRIPWKLLHIAGCRLPSPSRTAVPSQLVQHSVLLAYVLDPLSLPRLLLPASRFCFSIPHLPKRRLAARPTRLHR